jgi:hypothetical protein
MDPEKQVRVLTLEGAFGRINITSQASSMYF